MGGLETVLGRSSGGLGAFRGSLATSWGGRVVLLLAVGLIVLWIHPFGQVKSNIRTNLGQPESGRLRFPLKIWVRAEAVYPHVQALEKVLLQ